MYAIHNPATGRYGPKLHGQAQHANRKLNDEFINETLITRQMEYEQNQIVSQRREMDMSYQSYEFDIEYKSIDIDGQMAKVNVNGRSNVPIGRRPGN